MKLRTTFFLVVLALAVVAVVAILWGPELATTLSLLFGGGAIALRREKLRLKLAEQDEAREVEVVESTHEAQAELKEIAHETQEIRTATGARMDAVAAELRGEYALPEWRPRSPAPPGVHRSPERAPES